MEIKVLFFARSRELAGTTEKILKLQEGCTTKTLVDELLAEFPDLSQIRGSFVLSLNQEYLSPGQEEVLTDGDEVAIIPPISGG